MKEIDDYTLLEKYCGKMKKGCKYHGKKNKKLLFIRITYKKGNQVNHVEFLERNKKRKNEEKDNVQYIKLDKPIIILDDINNPGKYKWYELEEIKSKKGGSKKGGSKKGGSKKGGSKKGKSKKTKKI